MKLSTVIKENLDEIVADWEAFARTLPAGQVMSTLALRDHSRENLQAIVEAMKSPKTSQKRATQAKDIAPTEESTTSAAAEHGALRQMAGFVPVQAFAESRAMRASVMAYWQRSGVAGQDSCSINEIALFDEGMDKALAPSVQRYSSQVLASRDMLLAVLGHGLRAPLSGIDRSAM